LKKRLQLIFPSQVVQKPITWELSKKFDVVFNVRRAKITETIGEIVLELEGDACVLEAAVSWLKGQGVQVEPVSHDSLES